MTTQRGERLGEVALGTQGHVADGTFIGLAGRSSGQGVRTESGPYRPGRGPGPGLHGSAMTEASRACAGAGRAGYVVGGAKLGRARPGPYLFARRQIGNTAESAGRSLAK